MTDKLIKPAQPMAQSFLVSDRVKQAMINSALEAYEDPKLWPRVPGTITVDVRLCWRTRWRALIAGRLLVKVKLHDHR